MSGDNVHISGCEFVDEMQKLGYDVLHEDSPIEGTYALIVEMAQKIAELEKKHEPKEE